MARTRNQRRKFANSKQAQRQRKALEREIASDARFIQHLTVKGAMPFPSRRKAKEARKESHAMDERARFQSGFRGLIPTQGNELSHKTGYVPTIRSKDGVAFIREKCWMRKPL